MCKLPQVLRGYSTHREGREMPVHWVPLVERICTIAAPGRAFLGAVCDSNYMLCNGSRDNRKFGSGRWVWRRIIDDKSFPLIEHRDEWGTRHLVTDRDYHRCPNDPTK